MMNIKKQPLLSLGERGLLFAGKPDDADVYHLFVD